MAWSRDHPGSTDRFLPLPIQPNSKQPRPHRQLICALTGIPEQFAVHSQAIEWRPPKRGDALPRRSGTKVAQRRRWRADSAQIIRQKSPQVPAVKVHWALFARSIGIAENRV